MVEPLTAHPLLIQSGILMHQCCFVPLSLQVAASPMAVRQALLRAAVPLWLPGQHCEQGPRVHGFSSMELTISPQNLCTMDCKFCGKFCKCQRLSVLLCVL